MQDFEDVTFGNDTGSLLSDCSVDFSFGTFGFPNYLIFFRPYIHGDCSLVGKTCIQCAHVCLIYRYLYIIEIKKKEECIEGN